MELDALRNAPGSGLRGTVKKAWLKKRKAKTIEKLKIALDEYEKALDSKVLIDVRQVLKAWDTKQDVQSKQLEQQLSQVSSNLKACQSVLAFQLRSDIDKCVTASEAQHEVTRKHVTTHITTAMHDLSYSHNEQLSEQRRQQHDRQQDDQFLNSLLFKEMHARMNDIEESHAETFHWMFEEDATHPWDSFCNWLQADDRLYWINGKAGSGKSTLMKFLVNDPRTGDLLAQWSSSSSPLIVKFFFWLSGSEMQRSLKGFLCSIIYQLVHEDRQLVTKLLHGNTGLLSKGNPGDWSKQELRRILMQMLDMLDGPLCIFLDGLDEFNQEDDLDQLLNLVEDSSILGKTKICISSRPEHYIAKRMSQYKQLRLQDLTARDMELCIRTKLEATRAQCLPASIDDDYLESMVSIIAEKADGVFLWVYYALSSLVRGMRNEDDFGVLLGRIKELPNGMHQLYIQMWNRLNEDQKHYQEEAATYFSYVATCFARNENYPLSLIEMLVVLDPQLQSIFLDDLKPQDPFSLAQKCELLKTRIITRSAGLLELSMDESYADDYTLSVECSQSTGTFDDSQSLTRSSSDQSREPLCYSASQNQSQESLSHSASQTDADFFPRESPQDEISHRAWIYSNRRLAVHQHTKLKYLHRTARDFLLCTEDGLRLLGKPKDSPLTRSYNILRARMATLVQGVLKFRAGGIEGLICNIKDYFNNHPMPNQQTELLIALRRLCQSLSVPGDPQNHIGYTAFWWSSDSSFEAQAARVGFFEYVQQFVQDRTSYIDPCRRGLLTLNAVSYRGAAYSSRSPGNMALVSWLASNGADLHMTYVLRHCIFTPASEILLAIDRSLDSEDGIILRQSYKTLHDILPYLGARSGRCLVRLSLEKNGFVGSHGSPWDFLPEMVNEGQIFVHLNILKLCYLVMERVEDRLPHVPQWR